jgi:hypothetical protein
VLTGLRTPRRDVLIALIDVLGAPGAETAGWMAAWEKVVEHQLAGESGEAVPTADLVRAGNEVSSNLTGPPVGLDDNDIWRFTDDNPVTIVCARLPDELRDSLPYTDPRDPDYVELVTYADPDALLHLYGHLRALNPRLEIRFSTTVEMRPADYETHLVILGGTDFNVLTRDMLSALHLLSSSMAWSSRPT